MAAKGRDQKKRERLSSPAQTPSTVGKTERVRGGKGDEPRAGVLEKKKKYTDKKLPNGLDVDESTAFFKKKKKAKKTGPSVKKRQGKRRKTSEKDLRKREERRYRAPMRKLTGPRKEKGRCPERGAEIRSLQSKVPKKKKTQGKGPMKKVQVSKEKPTK